MRLVACPEPWSTAESSKTRCDWLAAHRHCTTASRGDGRSTRRPAAVPRPDTGRAVDRPFRPRGDHQLRRAAPSLARRHGGRGLVQHRRPVSQSEQPRSSGHGHFPADGLCHRRLPPSRRRDPVAPDRPAADDRAAGLGAPSNVAACEADLDEIVYLDVLAEDARPQLADASQLAEALRLYDSPYHAELSWWTAPFEATDGIPHSSLISAAESERVEVDRTFPMTRHGERRPAIADDRATVLVLSTDGDGPENALRCGEAMSAMLLECTMAGLATCTVTHVTEIAAARELVAALTGRCRTSATADPGRPRSGFGAASAAHASSAAG